MALATRTPSTYDASGWLPELWTNKVIDSMKNQLVCWEAFDTSDWTSSLTKGDTLHIPVTGHVTAAEVIVNTKHATLDMLGTMVSLSIDQWYEAPIDIDDMTLKQTQVDWEGQAQGESAYAISKRLDTSIATLFSTLNGSSVYGADGQTLTDDILLAIKELLDEADVPMDGSRSLILDPSGVTDLLKIDKFIAAQYVNIGRVKNGLIGNSPIYGCDVRVTNNLVDAGTGNYAVMAHKQAIIGIKQMQDSWTEKYPDLHTTRFCAECLWGVVEARDAFGVPFYSRHN